MTRSLLITFVFAAVAGAAKTSELDVLVKVRSTLAKTEDGIPDEATLGKAIDMLTKAESSCPASASGELMQKLLSDARSGYEKLRELSNQPPADLKKLEATAKKAAAKLTKASAVDEGDTFLESKAEKKEREAKVAKAQTAKDKADEAVKSAQDAEAARKPLTTLLHSLSSVAAALRAGALKPKVQVLSEAPMVVVVDDWLGSAAQRALDMVPEVFASALAPTAAEGGQPVTLLPTNASEIGGTYSQGGEKPSLCLPVSESGEVSPTLLATIDKEIRQAKAAKKSSSGGADPPSYCDATTALVDDPPEDWDTEEDGDWVGEVMTAAQRYPASSGGCGPLTPALDKAVVHVDSVFFTTSSEAAVDVLDMAIGELLGFSYDAEAVGTTILNGLIAGPDLNATQPDDWDEEEDGKWEPPMLEASDATALLAELVNGKDSSAEVASGIGDHYSFSSSPQIVRYRAATAGGEEMEYGCSDFSRTASGPRARPHVAIVAELYLSGAGKQGGETSFPALGVKVEAKPGRIVIYESTLPDGSCDPAGSLVERTPLAKAAEDVLLMRKRYYSDRSFSRADVNGEGPQRPVPHVKCDLTPGGQLHCTRHEHVPAGKGDAVLPLREVANTRGCLPPKTSGACPAPSGYTPPPPPPPKAKKSKKPAEAAPATAADEKPPPPPASDAPAAPPPIVR